MFLNNYAPHHNLEYIRNTLSNKLMAKDFVIDKSGVKMVEMIGCTFIANENSIFGEVNWEYVQREIQWYKSESRYVADIPGGAPEIWKAVSSKDGMINSNYGWCIFSEENGNQYENVLTELRKNKFSRRANMIYTRPNMHYDYNKDGMSDFICTDAVTYLIRNDKIHAHVKMRSNDAVFGYKNDRAWQSYVLKMLAADLFVDVGDIIWSASSLHVYERHFKFIEEYFKNSQLKITRDDLRNRSGVAGNGSGSGTGVSGGGATSSGNSAGGTGTSNIGG